MPSSLAVTALFRRRLRRRPAVRAGAAGLALVVVATLAAALSRRDEGVTVALGQIDQGLRWALWLAAGPVLLALADDPVGRDRRDGIEALLQSRGARRVMPQRIAAGAVTVAAWLALPFAALVLLVAGLEQSPAAALHAVRLLTFGAVTGAALAVLAVACGFVGRDHGRLLLAAVVLLPWLVADAWQRSGWSIPGAIDGLLQLIAATGGP